MQELSVIGTGFGIVLLVLALLWGACVLIGIAFRPRSEKPAASVPAPAQATAPATAGDDTVPVVIAAAVAAALDRPHRILTISAPINDTHAWSQVGRIDHYQSHRMRAHWAWADRNWTPNP